MAQAGDERLQAPLIQGLFIHGRDLMFQALCFDRLSFSRFLLSWFFSIRFIMKCSEVLITGCLPDGTVAELFLIIVAMILLARRMEEAKIPFAPISLVRGVLQIATIKQIFLFYSFGKMINGAHSHNQNEDFQICICSDPNVWKTSDYAVKAVAVTLLAGLLVFGVVNRSPLVPAVLEAVPVLPDAAQALPIYPAVQGDDIDDVLENAPVATRHNSPLGSWL